MNATQLLAHFDRLAEAPNAVPRLRRFILDLAVRGKLVEQDAGDEPATVSISSAESDDPLHTIPASWIWARISQLTDMVTDGEHLTPPRVFDRHVPLVTAKNVRDGEMDYGTTDWVSNETAEKAWRRCRPTVGDILMVCVGATTGRLCILRKHHDMVLVRSVAVIRPAKNVFVDFLAIAIRSPVGQRQIWSSVKVTAQPCLYINRINSLAIPVPPVAEQHRIVAKVDELMALCDQLEAAQQERERRRDRLAAASLQRLNQPALDATPEAQREHARFHLHHLPRLTTRPEHIKALRQLLVNLAVVGKLAQSDLNDEPAGALLEKVWEEKKSRGLLKQAKGSREGDIDLTVNTLPAGWTWTTFESFATEIATGPFGSALHQSDYIDGGIPLVNPSHMIEGRIVANPKISVMDETANSLASYRMKSGDVVMARRGEVGRAAIVTDAEAGWLCGTGSFFVSFHKEIDRQFVILLLRSDAIRRYLAGEAVGTTMVNLNHGILKRIPLGLPPAAEQHRIVAKVDELMALCDQLEARLTTTQTDSRRLLEAVLDAALAPA